MRTIGRDELRNKLDAGQDVKLVMTMGSWAFNAAHIPGSIQIDSLERVEDLLTQDDEIVVCCSDPACVASRYAQEQFIEHGYENVRLYEGGLADWADAGFDLAGERAEAAAQRSEREGGSND